MAPAATTSLDLYRSLYLIRAAEGLIVEHYPEDEMRTPMHMSMGQEAVSVGLCAALGEAGQVYGSYRSHALFLAKTEDPERFFGELYGRVNGTACGKQGSMHLAAPERGLMATSAIVGGTISAAVGTAFANKRLGNGRYCAALFGDGALETGEFWEALNAACVLQVPVLFLCEDNDYAVHSAKAVRHGFKLIEDVVSQFRCATFEVADALDVESIRRYIAEALAVARLDNGTPAFLRVRTCRYLDHIGITEDFDVGYRTREEADWWRERDPIKRQRRRLLEQGMTEVEVLAEEHKINKRLDAAVKAAREAPAPDPAELRMGIFCDAAS